MTNSKYTDHLNFLTSNGCSVLANGPLIGQRMSEMIEIALEAIEAEDNAHARYRLEKAMNAIEPVARLYHELRQLRENVAFDQARTFQPEVEPANDSYAEQRLSKWLPLLE